MRRAEIYLIDDGHGWYAAVIPLIGGELYRSPVFGTGESAMADARLWCRANDIDWKRD